MIGLCMVCTILCALETRCFALLHDVCVMGRQAFMLESVLFVGLAGDYETNMGKRN